MSYNLKDEIDNTAMHLAAEAGHEAVVHSLLRGGGGSAMFSQLDLLQAWMDTAGGQ